MKNSIRMCGVGIASLLLLTSVDAANFSETQLVARQPDKSVRAPRDTRQLSNRTDLTNLFKQQPEIRIIVGLETPQEIDRVGQTDDRTRQQAVSTRQTQVLGRVQGLNVRNITRFQFHPFIAMTVDETALGQLLADPDVTSVSEDGLIFPLLVDTVSLTRADSAWAEGFRGAGQTIAVIDSGLDATHPFFAGKVVAEACFSNPGAIGSTSLCPNGQPQQIGTGAGINCPDNSIGCWHGTHVAGIAAGNYGQLTASSGGMAPGASVMPIQVFQKDCSSGTCQLAAYYSDIMQSLEYVYSMRNTYTIAAANLSLGGMNFTSACDYESPGVTSAIQSLRAANIATVIASGNAAMSDAVSFPGCISAAISVGATTKQNAIASYSNSASYLSLLAPGSSIDSSVPGGGYGYTSGTSMAAPHVSGAWATLKSAKPTATVSEVLAALTDTGTPITDPRNGITKRSIKIGDAGAQLGALGVLLGRAEAQASSVITISPTDLLAKEAGLVPASFTVTRTGSTGSALTVQYKIGGTAAPGADYTALSGTLTISAGASTGSITVAPLDDALVESNETIVVTILSATGYTVGTPAAATVKIASDDATAGPTARAPQESTGPRSIGAVERKIKK